MSQQILQELPIPVPEPTYGEKVLRVAEGYSKTLKSLDDALRAKRTFKRGLMQQLLTGRKRFPELRDRPWVRHPFSDYFVEKSFANADRTVDLVYSCTKTAGIVPQAERF